MELQATLQGGRDVEGDDDDVVDGQHGGRQVELAPGMDVDAVPVPVTKVSDNLRPPKGHTGRDGLQQGCEEPRGVDTVQIQSGATKSEPLKGAS